MGAGRKASVSRVAYPNIIPWSPAPSPLLPDSSTPCAMSADCCPSATRTAHVSPSKPIGRIVVADRPHPLAHQPFVLDMRPRADLARQHHHSGLDQGLAGDPAVGVLLQRGVEHRVGDLVGHLVRMARGDGFRGEDLGAGASMTPGKGVVRGKCDLTLFASSRSGRSSDGYGPWPVDGRKAPKGGQVGPGESWGRGHRRLTGTWAAGILRGSSCAPVAQLDRVPGYEPGGREFESLRARQLPPNSRLEESWGIERNATDARGSQLHCRTS